jgi:hypothetical protein
VSRVEQLFREGFPMLSRESEHFQRAEFREAFIDQDLTRCQQGVRVPSHGPGVHICCTVFCGFAR